MNLSAISVVAVGLLAAGTALAHHSFSMFDDKQEIVLKGTLKQVQWTNPHIFVQVLVPDSQGKLVEWSIEGNSPNLIARGNRSGLQLKGMKPGEPIIVTASPLRNGAPGGSLISVTLADGRLMYGEAYRAVPPKEAEKKEIAPAR